MKKYFVGMIVLALAVIPIVGCAGGGFPVPNNLEDVVITLERTACFGTCPVYTLVIYGSGTVIYEGEDFVKIKGKQETTISQEEIKQLISEFETVDYFSLNDSYTERTITDAETVTTSITIDGKTKTIEHYHGDFSAPKQLTELEDKIDVIVNSNQWIQ